MKNENNNWKWCNAWISPVAKVEIYSVHFEECLQAGWWWQLPPDASCAWKDGADWRKPGEQHKSIKAWLFSIYIIILWVLCIILERIYKISSVYALQQFICSHINNFTLVHASFNFCNILMSDPFLVTRELFFFTKCALWNHSYINILHWQKVSNKH